MGLRYSEAFIEQALFKVYSRGGRTVQSVADDLNVNCHTVKNLMKRKESSAAVLSATKERRPQDWTAEQQLIALHQTHDLSGEALQTPDMAVIDEQQSNKALLLIHTYPAETDLEATSKMDGWAASPAERMVQLCRMTGCRLGLITNGERWMLIDAPVGAVTTFASWYARLWSQEQITLQAFVHLLGIRRFFVDTAEQLPALIDRSLKFQDEVTDALGEQVRRAVEVLIQSLDKADIDRNRELLRDVAPTELYEAGLTVMMRLVFLLSAEERGLLLLGDERYEAHYALSTLRLQLRAESEEILERRWDAWSRLLAIFRAVFGGIEHESLRMPALGGSLFDPDRFPFLEGRAKGSNWRADMAKPLPIDNRTVLLLLEAIQQFQGRTLSYRALDVEQIGYVYEGLLERTVKRTSEVTLELDATKSAKSPWVTLGELESARLDGSTQLANLLQERSGCSANRIRNDLAKVVDDTVADRLLTACQTNTDLRDRIKPYAHLLRADPWGYPLVYPKGAFIVTTGSDRRETGDHYTPKSLTEAIVTETLTPIAYVGPAEGKPREEWVLKSPAELLDLKICDPAMGSGAFLVQACRWLSDRLVEAWSLAEKNGQFVTIDGDVIAEVTGKELLPRDAETRTVIARRLIAERCLYGVDLNPLAVELAKLSIWLVTLAKGRPFGFLDHNLRCGDSLLGIHRLDQLTELSMTPTGKGQQRLFGQNIERAVYEAIELRQRLREMPIRDIHDVEAMARLDSEARRKLEVPERIADAFIGEVLVAGANENALEIRLSSLTIRAEEAIEGNSESSRVIQIQAKEALSTDIPDGKVAHLAFHWPLEFPEIFSVHEAGFDAVIGNPPFLGGKKITGVFSERYREYLVNRIANGVRGHADLIAYFLLRVVSICRPLRSFGLITSNSIAEGDTRDVGLRQILLQQVEIYNAIRSEQWPGNASVSTSRIHAFKGHWQGIRFLDQAAVEVVTDKTRHKDDAFEVPISAGWLDNKDWEPLPINDSDATSALQEPGTRIWVGTLYAGVSKHFTNDAFRNDLRTAVAEHFTMFLQRGLQISVNDQLVEPVRVEVLVSEQAEGPAPYVFQKTIDGVLVSITVGLNTGRGLASDDDETPDFERERSAATAGWTVFCNDRAVIVGDKGRLTGWGDGIPMYHYQFSVITGIIEFRSNLAEKLPVTTTKRALGTVQRFAPIN